MEVSEVLTVIQKGLDGTNDKSGLTWSFENPKRNLVVVKAETPVELGDRVGWAITLHWIQAFGFQIKVRDTIVKDKDKGALVIFEADVKGLSFNGKPRSRECKAVSTVFHSVVDRCNQLDTEKAALSAEKFATTLAL